MVVATRIVKVEKVIGEQLLADILITAVEGGIGYWSETVAYTHTEGPEHTRASILVIEPDPEEKADFEITTDVILLGVQRVLDSDPLADGTPNAQIRSWVIDSVLGDEASMIDADVADVIVQMALFEEIIYA